MNLLEIYEKNKEILTKSKLIDEMITQAIENGIKIEDDIVNCKNAYLYYTVTSNLTAQAKAPMGEQFLCNLLGFKKVSSRMDCGDAVDNDGKYYEFKNSFTNQAQNLNIRQIRLWQPVDYYFCFYINENNLDDSIFFILTKAQMEEEVALCGGYTHGTIEANLSNVNCEYSITIPIYNDKNE